MQSTAASNGGDDLSLQQLQENQRLWMQQYQQQWMAMQQYHPMMMHPQQQMMYPGYMPYYQHPQFQQQLPHQHYMPRQEGAGDQDLASGEENRTIWIGDLQQGMDEDYLTNCFSQSGEIFTVKIIRNRYTGHSERYGFIEFNSHEAAEKILQSFNGSQMPNSDQVFRLNWATFGMSDKRTEPGSELSIFVGDLAPDVTDAILSETFAQYPSVRGARVVVDPNSGRSKGYGFVRFGDNNERTRAIAEMNGMYCSSRPMRIGAATPKKQMMGQQQQQQYSSQDAVEMCMLLPDIIRLIPSKIDPDFKTFPCPRVPTSRHLIAVVLSGGHGSNGAMSQNGQTDGGSSNTTLFVGGLDSEITDEELRQSFSQYGDVVSVKIPPGKGCGFVQFDNRGSAENAMEGMNGAIIGKQTVRISWGRNSVNKQFRNDYNNQSNGAYYGSQGYGYAASNGYGNHQQSVS